MSSSNHSSSTENPKVLLKKKSKVLLKKKSTIFLNEHRNINKVNNIQ